ncbi:MAG: response regulator [Treponema sp.]|nr:response regulator [Treponema sp.]
MKNVLAIDASLNFFDFLKMQLSYQQIMLEYADSAKNAYTVMASCDPELIIIDIDVNLSAVMEFLKRKLTDPNAKHIPIILIGREEYRKQVTPLIYYGVLKFFSKPAKFDKLFRTIGQLIGANFEADETNSILETHVTDDTIFIEVSGGLNRAKMAMLRFRLSHCIKECKIKTPKVILMLSNMELTFMDTSNIVYLLDNILEDFSISNKHLTIVTKSQFVHDLIHGRQEYEHIRVTDCLTSIIDDIMGQFAGMDQIETITSKLLLPNKSTSMEELDFRFSTDYDGTIMKVSDNGGIVNVAIVDDDPIIQKILQVAFEKSGADTFVFSSGVSFLNSIPDHLYDIIVLDIFIPDMNGFDILHNLQHRDYAASILIYSQATNKEYVIKALTLGARNYLVKPQKPGLVVSSAFEMLLRRTDEL